MDVRSPVTNWIAATFGPQQMEDRVVVGNLSNTATIGGRDDGLDTWANLAINPGGGNVGIRTSNPDAPLHVVGNIKVVDGNQASGKLLTSDANGVASWTDPLTVETAVLDIISDSDDDTKIHTEQSADEDKIRFDVAGTQAMIIDNAGDLGIGTDNPLRKLDVRAVDTMAINWIAGVFGAVPSGDRVVMGNLGARAMIGAHSNALNAWADLAINAGGGNVGIGLDDPMHPLHMGTGAYCTIGGVWMNASDRSRKYNIADVDYGLDAIMQMRPASYSLKADHSQSIGFIAQEMELIVPEVVSGAEGDKGIAYGLLTAVIVKGMQELVSENAHLRDQLAVQRKTSAATQSELTAMKGEIERIKLVLGQ